MWVNNHNITQLKNTTQVLSRVDTVITSDVIGENRFCAKMMAQILHISVFYTDHKESLL